MQARRMGAHVERPAASERARPLRLPYQDADVTGRMALGLQRQRDAELAGRVYRLEGVRNDVRRLPAVGR